MAPCYSMFARMLIKYQKCLKDPVLSLFRSHFFFATLPILSADVLMGFCLHHALSILR